MEVKPTSSLSKNLGKEKSIHVKLDKDLYTAFRIWCFQKGITVQEIFQEFAKRLVEGETKANALVDSYILKSLNLPTNPNRIKSKKIVQLSEDDKSSLYDLISGEIQEEPVQGDQENIRSDNKG